MELIPGSASHWHLVLNHFPSIGALVAVVLLAAGLYLRSRDLTRAGLVSFVLLALLGFPTFVTGAGARWALDDAPDFALGAVLAHEDAAVIALTVLLVAGLFAWLELWRERRVGSPSDSAVGWGQLGVLALGALSVLLMLWTARLGGDINHPEIRAGELANGEAGLSMGIQNWVFSSAWIWVLMEATHFVGMALLFGVVLLLTVRLLGMGRNVPFSGLHRLLPLGMLGFVLNVVTGMVFFITDSGRYTAIKYGFYPKMVLIVLGGVAILYFTIFDRPWQIKAGDSAPMTAKALAVALLLLWTGVMAFGRLLPYLEGL